MTDENASPTTETAVETEESSLSLLASQMFGDDFKGEIPTEDETAQAPPEEVVETELESPPVDSDDLDTDEVVISSFDELVTNQEWEPEWAQSLKVALKVDGEPAEATIEELKNSFQIQEAAEKRLNDAKERAKVLHQEYAQKEQSLQEQLAIAAKLVEQAEDLHTPKTKADLDKLRIDDPGEYSARVAERKEKLEALEALKADVSGQFQEIVGNQSEAMEAARVAALPGQHKMMLEQIPEWQDQSRANSEMKQLSEYLLSIGFSEDDVSKASDHRVVVGFRKAMLYDNLMANTDAAKKKVVKVPKVMKPAAQKPIQQINQDRVKKSRARLRDNGGINEAYALLKAKRGGN
jgi:hypothetical protein